MLKIVRAHGAFSRRIRRPPVKMPECFCGPTHDDDVRW
jgi:hypothetical protein